MTTRATLREHVPPGLWPAGLFGDLDSGPTLLDRIDVVDLTIETNDGEPTFSASLELGEEVSIELMGTGGMSLVFGDSSTVSFSASITLASTVTVTISDLDFKLRFPNGWFTPSDGSEHAEVSASGSVTVTFSADSEPALEFSLDSSLSFGPFFIGSSGILVEATGVQFDFDRTSNISGPVEGTHYPAGGVFLGVYMEEVSVSFPSLLTDGNADSTFTLTTATVGTGGFTGTLLSTGLSRSLSIAGASFTVTDIEVGITQNALTAASIKGALDLAFFEDELDVEIAFDMEGNFSVLVDDSTGLVSVSLANVADLEIDELGVAILDGLLEVSVGGLLTPTAQHGSSSFSWPEMRFSGLRIRSDGKVYAPGGGIALEEEAAVDLFGFKLFVSSIGFGIDEDDRRWIQFSGGVSITGDLPMGASVEGLTVSWEQGPTDIRLSLGGVGLTLTVPDVLYFNGYLSLDFDAQAFHGILDLALYPLDLSVQVEFIAGNDSGLRYWYLDIDVELPVGIPLAATGLGIFGFRGIIAGNMAPTRAAGEDWYEDWYKQSPQGISGSKFASEAGAFAIGAGLTLGILPTGYVFAAKGTFLISFPGPIIMLEGRASVLRQRTKLTEGDPPFSALMVADLDALSYQIGVGVALEVSEVVDISGDAETFFDFTDPTRWYIDIGREPKEERIRAEFLSVLQANGYLGISLAGIATGGAMELGGSWTFGPVKATAQLGIEGGAGIGFDPTQLYGILSVYAALGLKVCGVGTDLGMRTTAAAETRDPYTLEITFSIQIGMPWPLEDIDIEISFAWDSGSDPAPEDPLDSVSFAHPLVAEGWSIATNHLLSGSGVSASSLPGASSAQAVPCDSRPILVFRRPMDDDAEVADNTASITSNGTEQVGGATIKRGITSVKLYQLSDGTSSATATLIAEAPPGTTETLYACWLASVEGGGAFEEADGGSVTATQLMLWGRNPFEFFSEWNDTPEWMVQTMGYPCGDKSSEVWICWWWSGPQEDVTGAQVFDELTFDHTGVAVTVFRPSPDPLWSLYAVRFTNSTVTLTLAETAAEVRLFFYFDSSEVRVEVDTGSGWTVAQNYTTSGFVSAVVQGTGVLSVRLVSHNVVGQGTADLYGTCYLTQASHDAHTAWVAAWTRFLSGAERWESEADIFEPNTHYYVEAETEVTVTGRSSNTDTFTHIFQFRTLGPPGHFGDVDGSQAGHELDSLERYVAATEPSSGGKPHYRTYGLSVAFNRDYVPEMFTGDLLLYVYDDNGEAVTDASGEALTYVAGAPPELSWTRSEQAWLTMLDESDCVGSSFDLGLVSSGATYTYENPDFELGPRRRYDLAVEGDGVEVYRTSFVTSAYRTLTEHLADRLDAVFDIEVDGASAPSDPAFEAAVTGTAALASTAGWLGYDFDADAEQEAFDDVWELLGLGAQVPPERVDVSLVASSSRRYAVLIESREPIPFDRMRLRLSTTIGSSTVPVAGWSMLRKADGTAALVFVPDGSLSAGDIPADTYTLLATLLASNTDVHPTSLDWVLPSGATSESTALELDLS